LSIDVVVGAVLSALFFCKIFQVTPRLAGLLALALTVWVIYTVDRLLDVRKKPADALDRHQFHQRHYRSLWASCAVITLLLIVLIFFLRLEVLKGGVVLSVIVMIYILVQRRLKFVKELAVAFFYTCGVLLLVWSLKDHTAISHYLVVIPFFIIALINLILFSWFEKETDEKNLQHSFVTHFGRDNSGKVLLLLFVIGTVFSLLVMWMGYYFESGIYLTMVFTLLMIYCFPRYFHVHERYRLWGDAVFLLPGLALLL